MRPVLICSDDLLKHLLGSLAFPGERPVYVVGTAALRTRLIRRGERALVGDLGDPALYRRARGRGPVVVTARPARYPRIVAAVSAALPEAAVLVVGDDDRTLPGTTAVSLAAVGERVIQPALHRADRKSVV